MAAFTPSPTAAPRARAHLARAAAGALLLFAAAVGACQAAPRADLDDDALGADGVGDAEAADTLAAPPQFGQRCGLNADGVYGRICTQRVDGGYGGSFVRSTFCNEALGRCEALSARCDDGWCFVPAGSFMAGWTPDVSYAPSRIDAPPQVQVLTRPYWAQATEVTQGQWLDVMAPTENPSPPPLNGCGLDCPVSNVTFFDAARFANRLGEREGRPACYALSDCDGPHPEGYGYECLRVDFAGPDCLGYRLPSEAEWELAARAGSPHCYPNGRATIPVTQEYATPCPTDQVVHEMDWFCGNSTVTYPDCPNLVVEMGAGVSCAGIHPVAQKRPNRLGLYDTGGNVMEWSGDVFRDLSGLYWDEPAVFPVVFVDPGFDPVLEFDPADANGKDLGVLRGGWFAGWWHHACSSQRSPVSFGREQHTENHPPFGFWGFRLVRTATADEIAALAAAGP